MWAGSRDYLPAFTLSSENVSVGLLSVISVGEGLSMALSKSSSGAMIDDGIVTNHLPGEDLRGNLRKVHGVGPGMIRRARVMCRGGSEAF